MNHRNQDLETKAQDLVKQYGKKAIDVVQRKLNAFPKDTHSRERDLILMLLSKVEILTEKLK